MKKLALILLAAPLAGCISIGGKPPKVPLLTLAPVQLPVGTSQDSAGAATMTVLFPTVPHELATNRVPVHSSATGVAYVKDAIWVEAPPRLFARLLGDTITAKTGRIVLGYRQTQLDPGATLSGELRQFGVDATTGEAVVQFDGVLTRSEANVFEKRRFEARVPVSPIEAGPVGVALNTAAGQVAAQVADWVGR